LPAVIDGSLDRSELYLVTVKNDKRTYTYLAYFGSCNGFAGLFGGDWNDCVIAWQPLPEPYKGQLMNKLKIANKEDRRAITAILAENGYKVWQGRDKSGKGNVYTYFVGYEDAEGEEK